MFYSSNERLVFRSYFPGRASFPQEHHPCMYSRLGRGSQAHNRKLGTRNIQLHKNDEKEDQNIKCQFYKIMKWMIRDGHWELFSFNDFSFHSWTEQNFQWAKRWTSRSLQNEGKRWANEIERVNGWGWKRWINEWMNERPFALLTERDRMKFFSCQVNGTWTFSKKLEILLKHMEIILAQIVLETEFMYNSECPNSKSENVYKYLLPSILQQLINHLSTYLQQKYKIT